MRSATAALIGSAILALPVLSACSTPSAPAKAASPQAKLASATVTKKDLEESSPQTGSLRYGDARDLPTDRAGTVTQVAPAGKVVGNGGVLYRLDTRAVVRLNGKVPAWRPLGPGTTDGADVAQLEHGLRALGYADDLLVDDHWSPATTQAVKDWQDDLGLDETGTIPLGEVVFTDGDVRVQAPVAHAGDRVQPGMPIIKVSDDTRQVTATLDPSQKALAPVGGTVNLTFPDGTATTGKIRSVVTRPGTEQQQDALEVTVSLPHEPAVDKQLEGSAVQVEFRHVLAENVLTVPVTALVALTTGGFGVQKIGANGALSYVPVTPGVFADTDVEITSDALAAGDKVVVTP